MEEQQLTGEIIGLAMKVHSALGPGFVESVHRNALGHELGKAGIQFECLKPILVRYDGIVVGKFEADMVVEGKVLIELKTVQTLVAAHEVQLVNYLAATGIDIGLLINFGASSLQFKRKPASFRSRPTPASPCESRPNPARLSCLLLRIL